MDLRIAVPAALTRPLRTRARRRCPSAPLACAACGCSTPPTGTSAAPSTGTRRSMRCAASCSSSRRRCARAGRRRARRGRRVRLGDARRRGVRAVRGGGARDPGRRRRGRDDERQPRLGGAARPPGAVRRGRRRARPHPRRRRSTPPSSWRTSTARSTCTASPSSSRSLVGRADPRRGADSGHGPGPCLRRGAREPAVVLAHCFASAGVVPQAAGGERDITAGGVDVVPPSIFEARIDYAALGHLHSRMRLAEAVRYSGAPLHYIFGETSPLRGGWLVDLDAAGFAAPLARPPGAPPAQRVTGDARGGARRPALADREQDWIQAVLTDPVRQQDAMARLRERFPFVARLEHRPRASGPRRPQLRRADGGPARRGPDRRASSSTCGRAPGVRRGGDRARRRGARRRRRRGARRMRIERLVIEGFGPFASRQEIDFAPLDEAGLFLITGRTGSGKSSILDAICFALYGPRPATTAPRPGSAATRRRRHADPGHARVPVGGDRGGSPAPPSTTARSSAATARRGRRRRRRSSAGTRRRRTGSGSRPGRSTSRSTSGPSCSSPASSSSR